MQEACGREGGRFDIGSVVLVFGRKGDAQRNGNRQ